MSDHVKAFVRYNVKFDGLKDATALKFTLMELAEEAKDNGDLAWITNGELAARTECDYRTAQRRMAKLHALGKIEPSRFQSIVVPLFRADKRPLVWKILNVPTLPPLPVGGFRPKRKHRGAVDRARRREWREAELLAHRFFDERMG